jgi:tetratricopeptide (TPR) repeat protein
VAAPSGGPCPPPVDDASHREALSLFRAGAHELRSIQEMEKRLWQLERRGRDDAPIGVTLALGTAHFHAGSLADAEREFRAVIAADPRSGDAHNNLAVVLMLTDRLEEAEREADLAEKAGVAVSPRLREEIRKRKEASAPRW